MWNIRMRASRKKGKGRTAQGKKLFPLAIGPSPLAEDFVVEHISGAEGIYPKNRVHSIVQSYIDRARNHPKGKPDRIHITIEILDQRPQPITALPVVTLKCTSQAHAESYIRRLLVPACISEKAVRAAFSITRNNAVMRGAALVYANSGRRVEPDEVRGIRASRLGMSVDAESLLSQELAKFKINTLTVKEALVLASKVAACPDIIAELCVSDDPDYTTGYIASRDLGYVRIPHIKKMGSAAGGRVFFLRETADISSVVRYLEKIPVLVTSLSPCRGTYSIHEIIDRHHQ
jgi:6-carboxyhexanoate--CoA ligase